MDKRLGTYNLMRLNPQCGCIRYSFCHKPTDFSIQELFVQHLALTSYNKGSGTADGTLSYCDLASAVEEIETFQFLTGECLN